MGGGHGHRASSPNTSRSKASVWISAHADGRAGSGRDVWIRPEISFPSELSLKGDIALRDAERLEQEYNHHFECSPRSENMERLKPSTPGPAPDDHFGHQL